MGKHFGERVYYAEAATWGVLWKKVFLKISQNSQENTCARVSFLIWLQVAVDLSQVLHKVAFLKWSSIVRITYKYVDLHVKNDHGLTLCSWHENHKMLKINEEYNLSCSLQFESLLNLIKLYLNKGVFVPWM